MDALSDKEVFATICAIIRLEYNFLDEIKLIIVFDPLYISINGSSEREYS